MEDDTDDEDMEDVNLDNYRERQWRIVFEENDGGVDDAKVIEYRIVMKNNSSE